MAHPIRSFGVFSASFQTHEMIFQRHAAGAVALMTAALLVAVCAIAVEADEVGKPLRIVVVGDINGSYGSVGYSSHVETAVARIVELRPDLVIAVGDLIAGQRRSPRLRREHLEAMWRAFDRDVLDPLTSAGITFIPVPGNHDASADPAFALERTVFAEQWQDHRPDVNFTDVSHFPFRYAFTIDGVLFVVLDATRVGPVSASQRSWVASRLTQEAAGRRTRVVAGHLPIRAFTSGRENEILGDTELEQVLQHGGVDLYLSGHHHAFYPGHKDGIDFVSQSCLGAGPRRLIGTGNMSPRSFTLIELTPGDTRITAFRAPAFREPLDWNSLPRHIRSPAATLIRADLVKDGARPLATTGPGR